jgi:hypothetical protein
MITRSGIGELTGWRQSEKTSKRTAAIRRDTGRPVKGLKARPAPFVSRNQISW